MNYAVVALWATLGGGLVTVSGPKGMFNPLGLLVHMFLVGVHAALFARRASR